MNDIITTERAHIQLSLQVLRPLYPGMPDTEILASVLRNGAGECTPDAVARYAKSVKRFSTADVMQHFSVSKYKVAGSTAALRRRGVISQLGEPDENGYTRWVWVGTKRSRQ